jgi:hypothetical protein
MSRSDVADSWQVVSTRRRKVHLRSGGVEIGLLILRLVAVGLLIWIGWLHLNLWRAGYRHIPTVGPLFLLAAVSSPVIALGMLLRPSRLFGLSGLGLVVGILGGLVASINVGLFGFTESWSAPSAVESIVAEIAAALALASWIALDVMVHSRRTKRVATAASKIAASTKRRTCLMMSSLPLRKPARSRARCESHR